MYTYVHIHIYIYINAYLYIYIIYTLSRRATRSAKTYGEGLKGMG
jgi:hypothetical protein